LIVVAELLRRKVRADAGLLVAPVVDVDTAVCQNNCSGHGVCDRSSRRCVCHTFWMQNGLAVLTGAQPNCGQSTLVNPVGGSIGEGSSCPPDNFAAESGVPLKD